MNGISNNCGTKGIDDCESISVVYFLLLTFIFQNGIHNGFCLFVLENTAIDAVIVDDGVCGMFLNSAF